MEMTCRALEASEYMGAKWAVAHIYLSHDEDAIPKTVEYVKKLFARTKVKTIGIALENACGYPACIHALPARAVRRHAHRNGLQPAGSCPAFFG